VPYIGPVKVSSCHEKAFGDGIIRIEGDVLQRENKGQELQLVRSHPKTTEIVVLSGKIYLYHRSRGAAKSYWSKAPLYHICIERQNEFLVTL
jgi:hypothetical protein